jgi:DNA-directed RNA polymerase specialized sigma24 family protein
MDDQVVAHLIQQAAAQARLLAMIGALPWSEVEDAQQELALDCIRRATHFDPARGDWMPFVRRLMRHRAYKLMLQQRALRRERLAQNCLGDNEWRFDASLHATSGGEATETTQMSIDIHAVLSRLPRMLAEVAETWIECESVTEVAGTMHVSRCTVHRHMRQLKAEFEAAGLDRYLVRVRKRHRRAAVKAHG